MARSPPRADCLVYALKRGDAAPLQSGEPNHIAQGLGPRAAIRRLKLEQMSGLERLEWLSQARLDALLGCCRLSMQSWRSGLRCYFAFAGESVARSSARACVAPPLWQMPSAPSVRIISRRGWTSCWLGLPSSAQRVPLPITWHTCEQLALLYGPRRGYVLHTGLVGSVFCCFPCRCSRKLLCAGQRHR